MNVIRPSLADDLFHIGAFPKDDQTLTRKGWIHDDVWAFLRLRTSQSSKWSVEVALGSMEIGWWGMEHRPEVSLQPWTVSLRAARKISVGIYDHLSVIALPRCFIHLRIILNYSFLTAVPNLSLQLPR